MGHTVLFGSLPSTRKVHLHDIIIYCVHVELKVDKCTWPGSMMSLCVSYVWPDFHWCPSGVLAHTTTQSVCVPFNKPNQYLNLKGSQMLHRILGQRHVSMEYVCVCIVCLHVRLLLVGVPKTSVL